MKVLVGHFVNEANAGVPHYSDISNFTIAFGDECIAKMEIKDIFDDAGIEIIPSIYASTGASGIISKEAFEYVLSCFTNTVKEHLGELDGIYLMLHGASEVEGLGSGDHEILWQIRKIVGPYLPIAIACDPHGNLCKEYTDQIQIIRSYRQSPHTDAKETRRIVAGMLVDLLKDRQNIHAIYRKLPIIIGGEQSVSTDEPVASFNRYMDEMEKDPRVRSASWHVGYIRHDSPVAGSGVIVIPQTEADIPYCEEKCDELAKFVFDRRNEFHYTGLTALPEKALELALANTDEGYISITDSGDNTTSGAPGWNTYVLRQFLAVKDLKKKVLFASICHPACYDSIKDLAEGSEAHITLGMGHNYLSEPVELDVVIGQSGDLVRTVSLGVEEGAKACGKCVLVHVKGTPIDIVVANERQAMREPIHYRMANINPNDYDIIIIKVGYNYPMFTSNGRWWVMSLTEGATLQDTARLPFKLIMRPMWPIDKI